MIDEALNRTGLSGDLGWNEADEPQLGGVGGALLVVASVAVWGAVWLLSGIPPLVTVVTRASGSLQIEADHLTAGNGKWRSKQV